MVLEKESNPSNPNETILAYKSNVDVYIKKNSDPPRPYIQSWIKEIISHLENPQTAKVIEIGSATGHHAKFFQQHGINIEVSDTIDGFINHLKKEFKIVHKINLLEDELPGMYDLIYMNAVLLHFDIPTTKQILETLKTKLNRNGIIALSLKHKSTTHSEQTTEGLSQDNSQKRFFQYWESEDFRSFLSSIPLDIVSFRDDDSANGNRWIRVLVR